VRYVVIPQRPKREPKRREEQRKPKPKGRKPGKPRRQVLKSQGVAGVLAV